MGVLLSERKTLSLNCNPFTGVTLRVVTRSKRQQLNIESLSLLSVFSAGKQRLRSRDGGLGHCVGCCINVHSRLKTNGDTTAVYIKQDRPIIIIRVDIFSIGDYTQPILSLSIARKKLSAWKKQRVKICEKNIF